ncbi:hypothetical protein L7F22_007120 [Adiantum nelumboides]|nr:hypothetical protein [Adiantum nelumboides]
MPLPLSNHPTLAAVKANPSAGVILSLSIFQEPSTGKTTNSFLSREVSDLAAFLVAEDDSIAAARVPTPADAGAIFPAAHDATSAINAAMIDAILAAKTAINLAVVGVFDVQHWCRSCHNCQVNGNKRLLYGPRQAVIANGPFEKWGIDAMGPLPRTVNGKLYILVAIDYMTRWVEAQSVAKVNEKTVSKFVYTHICCRFGTPLEIVSDNGLGFKRGLLTKVCEELKISHRHSTPYYPQSNGLVEKANGIIAGIIRKMVESKPKRWDNFLDGAIWAYKTTYRDATQFTPFHLVYGQEALQPIELNIPKFKLTNRQEQNNDEAWIDRLLNLVELKWKREAAYHCYEKKALQLKDKLNEGIKDKKIKEKSLVLRYNNALDNRFDAKFERRWEGPFIVKKAFTGGYYQLMDLNGKEHPRKVNGYRLNPYLSHILPALFETKQVSKKTKKDVLAIDEFAARTGGKRTGFGPQSSLAHYL